MERVSVVKMIRVQAQHHITIGSLARQHYVQAISVNAVNT